jgi:hypothetical protein
MLLSPLCLSWLLLFPVTVTFLLSSLIPIPPSFSIESTLQRGPVAPTSTPSVRCTLWWGLARKGTSFTPGHPTRSSSSSSSCLWSTKTQLTLQTPHAFLEICRRSYRYSTVNLLFPLQWVVNLELQ